jgi:hypothetical protein
MKLVAISVVKNDADIVEAYVRHTRAWVDHHLIFDHQSTDGTREILAALIDEGFALSVYGGDSVANLQQARSNHLMRLAFAEHAADWVLPLDADEFLQCAGDRSGLEHALASADPARPASVRLQNYLLSDADDASVSNPVLRIQHRSPGVGNTVKVFCGRALGRAPDVSAGMGNHEIFRGGVSEHPQLLDSVTLAHFPLRSAAQQVIRVVSAELQKLSRGRAAEGLALHYRLGFQLLAEDPGRFIRLLQGRHQNLRYDPIRYLGTELRFHRAADELTRTARALMPLLEQIAKSHGRLIDGVGSSEAAGTEQIQSLKLDERLPNDLDHESLFSGFVAKDGWQPEEGPYAEAFLPRFHWATGPETHLIISATEEGAMILDGEVLTYSDQQSTVIELNGCEVARLTFPRVNEKQRLHVRMRVRNGANDLVLRHTKWIENANDPRKLALIFLSLRVLRE